jgi:hypothetical protein
MVRVFIYSFLPNNFLTSVPVGIIPPRMTFSFKPFNQSIQPRKAAFGNTQVVSSNCWLEVIDQFNNYINDFNYNKNTMNNNLKYKLKVMNTKFNHKSNNYCN